MQAFLGIALLLFLAWAISQDRRNIPWRLLLFGFAIQAILAVVLLKVEWIADALLILNSLVAAIEQGTQAGTDFLFGYLGGGALPFEPTPTAATYLFAFRVLPQVVVFSAIIAILWYWRVLPAVVRGVGWALQKTLRVSGALGTSGAASLFLGMVETPLVIRAYLRNLSRTEYFTVMTFGMSTVAGSVMILYASVLKDMLPGVVGHILSASLLNIIGAIYVARIMYPAPTEAATHVDADSLGYDSFMDAVTRGTTDGLNLAVNVGAMLLVLISLVAITNGLLGWLPFADGELTLQSLLGWVLSPIAWLIGIPWADATQAGALLGTKFVLNELVAYIDLASIQHDLAPESRLILLYALCGFANFGSLGILLGGLHILVPERRQETLKIAPKSLISGTIVTLISGAIVGLANQL